MHIKFNALYPCFFKISSFETFKLRFNILPSTPEGTKNSATFHVHLADFFYKILRSAGPGERRGQNSSEFIQVFRRCSQITQRFIDLRSYSVTNKAA